MSQPATQCGASQADGLVGQWLSVDELSEIDFFKSSKRAFKVKLNTNLAPTPGQKEPGIKAVVRREYQKGDIICKAGEYGSTAFLILEGSAAAFLPETFTPAAVRGRKPSSVAWLKQLFSRRSHSERAAAPEDADVGEVSRFASLSVENAPPARSLRPGDFFGIDTCINLYPREVTVRAEERCVVLEMLRSVLDSIRDAGTAAGKIDAAYSENAIRTQLTLSDLFAHLSRDQLEGLVGRAELLTPESDQIRNNVVYNEADPADAIYLVRAGTIKLSEKRAGGEAVLTYLGRGSAFGLESVLPSRTATALRLQCTSHPSLFAPVEVGPAGLTLGRGESCDVVLPSENKAVGRKHCRLELRNGEIFLTDLNSANFTVLNGERIQESRVTAGDRITVVEYAFELSRAPLASATGGGPLRLASASGLDNFEIIRIKSDDISQLTQANDRFFRAAQGIGRALEASIAQKSPEERALLTELVELNLYNSQNTLLIDLDRCTRCDQCVRACATAHGGVARFTRDGPRFGKYLVTMACRSCTDPKCQVGCPVSSIRRQDSLEIRIEDWCIGCERCANQCPFGNINMVELAAAPAAAPIETPSLKLRATVCDLCAGYEGPSCVYACPHDAAIRVNPSAFLSIADQA